MNSYIFRKSSLERINSPEQLNDYIKVSNPSVWIIIVSVIVFLVSVFAWGIFDSLPTIITASGIAEDAKVICYISREDAAKISVGMKVKSDEWEGTITDISAKPMSYEEASAEYTDAYTLYSLNLSDWNYSVTIEAGGLSEGIFDLSIIADSVKPISFLLSLGHKNV